MAIHPDEDTLKRLRRLQEVFRPSGPIDHQDLFRGRIDQLAAISSAVGQTGQHAVVFGERGVGKTSLAAVSAEIGSHLLTARLNCDTGDNFNSIWTKAADEFDTLALLSPYRDEPGTVRALNAAAAILTDEPLGPDQVRRALRVLCAEQRVLLFFDEFDRVVDSGTHSLFADTIKTLSDQLVGATVIIVGVADDVDTLIEEHRSTERAIIQIKMPRMTPAEIAEIITEGYQALGLSARQAVMRFLTYIPQGLPHFAHLLAQRAAEEAILDGREYVSENDVLLAVSTAVADADDSLVRGYTEATSSSHKDALFKDVLLAVALAEVDDLGYFAPGDLREPLSEIRDKPMEIPHFARHLVQFCKDERGPALERRGGEHRWRYRFTNPMMRPYVVMRAIESGTDLSVLDLTPGMSDDPLPTPIAPELPFGQSPNDAAD